MEFKSCKNEYKKNIEELQWEITESVDRNGIVTKEFETAKAEYNQKILDLNAKVSSNEETVAGLTEALQNLESGELKSCQGQIEQMLAEKTEAADLLSELQDTLADLQTT